MQINERADFIDFSGSSLLEHELAKANEWFCASFYPGDQVDALRAQSVACTVDIKNKCKIYYN